MKTILLALMFTLYLQDAVASQEGVLPLTEFQIKSNGIDNSGPIIVNGKKIDGIFSSLSVSAFGKNIEVPTSVLSTIQIKHHNGIQLSYEAGYRALGGKTVYIKFIFGFTSGVDDEVTISVRENGDVKVLSH